MAVFVAAATMLALPETAQPQADMVRLSFESGAKGAVIDRDIFGQFAEHLGTGIYGGIWVGKDSPIPNVRGIRSDVVQALRAIRVPNVRWPGGCFADEYHWRHGIGPAEKRPATLNASWGGVIEPNSFGTHEFMDFAEQIGAEAFVSVNIGSGTAQEAADWLEYMTAEQPTALAQERMRNGRIDPWKIKYVGLGNENWGCGGAMSTAHYVEEMKRFAHYTRNLNPAQAGDGNPQRMQRIAVGSDGGESDYTEEVMKAWKSKVWSWDIEGVSLHSYTVGGWPPKMASTNFGEGDYMKLVAETLEMENKIAKQSAIMDRYDPDKKLSLVVDEWGVWLAPAPGTNPGFLQQQNSLRDAIIAALNLNIFMRHADRVRISNIAQMTNVLQAMILTDGPRMVLTPTYHVYHMYRPFQGATQLPLELSTGDYRLGGTSVPRVNAVAARDDDGRTWIAIINVDARQTASVDLTGLGAKSAAGEQLTAARVDSVNSFGAKPQVVPAPIKAAMASGRLMLNLPAKSVAVVALGASR